MQIRVADGDVWVRPLTNKRYIKSSGKLNHAALKGRAISAPKVGARVWKSEISGRLRSIADDIRKHAERRVQQLIQAANDRGERGSECQFRGVMFSRVGEVRQWEIDQCDVIFDPITDEADPNYDPAHANLVFFTKPPDQILSVIEELVDRVTVLSADKLDQIPVAIGGPPN